MCAVYINKYFIKPKKVLHFYNESINYFAHCPSPNIVKEQPYAEEKKPAHASSCADGVVYSQYCGPAEHLGLHDGHLLCHSTRMGRLFCMHALFVCIVFFTYEDTHIQSFFKYQKVAEVLEIVK